MIIENKVAAASAGGGIAAVAATVAMDYLYKQPIPQSAVEVLLVYIVAQGGAFIAGYVAKHTHRPDLTATEVLPPTGSPSMADPGPEGGPPDAVLTEAQAGQVRAAIDAAVAAIPPAAPTPVVVPVTVTAPPAAAWDAPAAPAPAPAPAAPAVPQAGATAAMV